MTSLERATEKMKEGIGYHAPLSASIKFDFADQGVIRIDGRSSPAIVDNQDLPVDCTVETTLEDFKAMVEGDLDPQTAFMTGKVRIKGDMTLALQLGNLLRQAR